MTYRGRIQNGVVVFEGRRRPKEGTTVEVRPLASRAARSPARKAKATNGKKAPNRGSGRGSANGAPSHSTGPLDDIARDQGVTRIAPFEELLGGWPAGEAEDSFDDAVSDWRAEEPRRGDF